MIADATDSTRTLDWDVRVSISSTTSGVTLHYRVIWTHDPWVADIPRLSDELRELQHRWRELLEKHAAIRERLRAENRAKSIVVGKALAPHRPPLEPERGAPRLDHQQRCMTRLGPKHRRLDRRSGRVFGPPTAACDTRRK